MLIDYAYTVSYSTYLLGKSVLLAYLLAVLLSIPEQSDTPDSETLLFSSPVFLYTHAHQVLFYNGETWVPKTATPHDRLMSTLPKPVDSCLPVWVLIYMDARPEEPEGLVGRDTVFPVQAASPHPARFGIWSKRRNARFFGLSLWKTETIYAGYEVIYLMPYD